MTLSSTCSIDRYYDPTTDSFISVDPDVQSTDQPYTFVNDDPLNNSDPLGLRPRPCNGTWVKEKSGVMTCESDDSVSYTQTLKTIEKALGNSNVDSGLGLTGTEITIVAKKMMAEMSLNGGKPLSTGAADALDGLSGLGKGLSNGAGLAGSAIVISDDLANHDSPAYIAGDVLTQVGAGSLAGGAAAAACSETGPGALLCGAVGFLVGYLASSSSGIIYNYLFSTK